mmetsp:Transcript_14370/g.17412  ORF Transcript_14370/g.17412 Transcript_14370/m.17412 type:complete len:171 (-) Transcript_14370:1191-1703(-)|eukprot:CAMPEP_0197852136 /NCGR_PEP_ID=MMETSP1438-20131217/19736_1 /TAXON_ID=1461541 /ORGANISM="Pterosperma sp., Strain CCMP1384" /LENGTH=170 /DNA_ID=CAMNT_0043466015 /DNA_START=125 /DNA_END=637 /DNA_ORIENTATION=-
MKYCLAFLLVVMLFVDTQSRSLPQELSKVDEDLVKLAARRQLVQFSGGNYAQVAQPGRLPGGFDMQGRPLGNIVGDSQPAGNDARAALVDMPTGVQLHQPKSVEDMDPIFDPKVIIFLLVVGISMGFGGYSYRRYLQNKEEQAQALVIKDGDTPMERIKKLKKKLENAQG